MKKLSQLITCCTMLATFLAITLLLTSCSWGGSNENSEEKGTEISTTGDEVYSTAEKMPEFPGGEEALMKYLGNIIEYPELAKKEKIEGKVFIGFVVQKDGRIVNVEVLEGIGGGCDEEAVRVVSGMPDWSPGYEKGKPVKVKYTLPIAFKLL